MIKLKQLMPENLDYEDFDTNYIIIGTIDEFDYDYIESTKTSNGNTTHLMLGYEGINWRYNPITKTVYWWNMDDVEEYTQECVEDHLKQKYNVEVVANKAMRVARNNVLGDDEGLLSYQRKMRNRETHPFPTVYEHNQS